MEDARVRNTRPRSTPAETPRAYQIKTEINASSLSWQVCFFLPHRIFLSNGEKN